MSCAFYFYIGVTAQTMQTVLTQGVQTTVIFNLGLKNLLLPTPLFPFIKMTKDSISLLKNIWRKLYFVLEVNSLLV